MLSPGGNKFSLADAVERLFGLPLSKHLSIKTALTSLIRSKVITAEKELLGGGYGSRKRIWIALDQLMLIHNAVILQGLFSDVRTISAILKDSGKFEYRRRMTDFARVILIGRQSIVGVSLLPEKVMLFLDLLGSEMDLSSHYLPNPFEALPQLVLPESIGAIQALLAQSTVLSNGDTMMAHYLNGDLEKAWEAARQLDIDDPTLGQYKALIEKEYAEAKEFDELLDFLT